MAWPSSGRDRHKPGAAPSFGGGRRGSSERTLRLAFLEPKLASVVRTGKLGGSLAGRHLEFEPRVAKAMVAANFPVHAMIDISDGLAAISGG